jgi:hypothetical protein
VLNETAIGVIRLGEFSTFGRFFTLDNFWNITKLWSTYFTEKLGKYLPT